MPRTEPSPEWSTATGGPPRVTIADLPPEILLQIIECVTAINDFERRRLTDAGLGHSDGAPVTAQDALRAMMTGLFGIDPAPAPAGGAAAPGAGAAAGAGAGTVMYARGANPFAPEPAATPVAAGDDTDDDMPPLEPIPAGTTTSSVSAVVSTSPAAPTAASNSAAASGRASTSALDADADDMPALEPIPGAAVPTPPATAANVNPFATFLSAFTNPLSGNRSPDSRVEPQPGTAAPALANRAATSEPDSEDDMPALEHIDGTAVAPPPAAPRASGVDSDAEMPDLESIDSAEDARLKAALPDDAMPPLEPADGVLDAEATRVRQQAHAVLQAMLNGPLRSNGEDDDEEEDMADEDGEDDEYDEDEGMWEGSDDEDDGEDDEYGYHDEAEDRIFADGLPLDPMLPLLFINRPFLHAARKRLYRDVKVATPYVASLLHRSLAAETPAGWIEGDARGAGGVPDGEVVRKNYLGDVVRSLSIVAEGDASLGRGGGEHYIALMRHCRFVETLVVRPMFFNSATKPLLEALAGLSRLKEIDIQSSDEPNNPFIVTTARLYKLMQQSWPDLEMLAVANLKPAEAGPPSEEDEMWEIVEELEQADWEQSQAYKQAKAVVDAERGRGPSSSEDEVDAPAGADKKEKPKRCGLTNVCLVGFNMTGSEMDLILQDSGKTLEILTLLKPGYLFNRYDLASTLLTFGHNLTHLDVVLPATWDPAPSPALGVPKPANPARPKDYVVGKPDEAHLNKLARHTYLLDAVLPYLPHLVNLRFEGPYASTAVFNCFPASLTHVAYGDCPEIKPKVLAKLLTRTVTRVKPVTQPNGSKVNKSCKVKIARGLKCLTIINDDINWTDADISALDIATTERNMCLHLSSDAGAAGMRFLGLPLAGGIGGLHGLGGLGGFRDLAGGLGGLNAGGEAPAAGAPRPAGAAANAPRPRPAGAQAAAAARPGAAAAPTRAMGGTPPIARPAPAPAAAAAPTRAIGGTPPITRPAPATRPATGAAPAQAQTTTAATPAARPNPARTAGREFGGLTGLAGMWASR